MRTLFKSIVLIILLFHLSNCEDTISPKAELPEKYAVNLILRGDTTFQIAYVSQLYDVEGFDPYANDEDPAFQEAEVSLKYIDSDTRYFFRDTVDNENVNSRYGTPSKYYYLDNFQPTFGKEIELNISFPNGERISSLTKVPDEIIIDIIGTTPRIPGPLLNRDTTYINVVWENGDVELLKAKKVNIVYYRKEMSGEKFRFIKKVPIVIYNENGNIFTDYNDISYDNDLKIERRLLEQALEEISEGDPAKGRYSIAPLEVDILTYDENLTNYQSANLFFDLGFTIRNNPADLTNIDGGLGYFASYSHLKKMINFESNYLLNNFGYLTEPPGSNQKLE